MTLTKLLAMTPMRARTGVSRRPGRNANGSWSTMDWRVHDGAMAMMMAMFRYDHASVQQAHGPDGDGCHEYPFHGSVSNLSC